MANQMAAVLLKANLGFYDGPIPEALDQELASLLDTAETRLRQQNHIELNDSQSDTQLIVSYAAWLYRSKVTGAAQPAGLRQDIRDRQIHQVTGEETP